MESAASTGVQSVPEMQRKLSQGSGQGTFKGKDMYQTLVEKRKADFDIQQLRNRIETMRRKEEATQRLLEKAAEREEQQRKVHSRKLEEETAKQLLKTQQRLMQDQHRIALKEQREQALQRKRELVLSTMQEKQSIALSAKEALKLMDAKARSLGESQRIAKLRQTQEVRRQEERWQEGRLERKAEAVGHVQESYTERMDLERSKHQQKLDEINQLRAQAVQAESALKAKAAKLKEIPSP